MDSGYEQVEHRIKQVINSFNESRNLLADIEDDLHTSGQLRRGESDKIAEVDSELLKCSSSLQGGWDRVLRVSQSYEYSAWGRILMMANNVGNSLKARQPLLQMIRSCLNWIGPLLESRKTCTAYWRILIRIKDFLIMDRWLQLPKWNLHHPWKD